MLAYGNIVILVKSFACEILAYVHMFLCVYVSIMYAVFWQFVLVIPQNEYGILVIITED